MDQAPDRDPREDERDPPTEAGSPGDAGAGDESSSPAADKLPGAPADDDSPLGDTDQHSDA